VKASFRLLVVPDHKAKSARWALFGNRLSNDHLEICRPVSPTADITAINANRHRRARDRHLVPFRLASARKHRLLGAELGFETFGDAHRVVPDRRRVHGLADRQYFRQQSGGDAVGRKRSPTRLERKQIGRNAFGQSDGHRRDGPSWCFSAAFTSRRLKRSGS
jgi:hypothetical protein